jgi:hypothetical protein
MKWNYLLQPPDAKILAQQASPRIRDSLGIFTAKLFTLWLHQHWLHACYARTALRYYDECLFEFSNGYNG